MKELAALQRSFQRHIDRPGRAMSRAVASGPNASAERRLGVYEAAYRSRLVEALSSDYEVLHKLLGETRFEQLAREFIRAYPSRHPNLRWYGAELDDFIARAPRWRRRPVLSELARFEWALGMAFDAADAQPLTADELACVPGSDWPKLRFRQHPSVRLIALRTNAPSLWAAVRAGEALPRVRARKRSQHWLIWRRELTPYYRPAADDEAWALQALERGRNFAALCSGLSRVGGAPRAAVRAAQLLRNWISEGVLRGK
jgi:hypothetical protein